MKRKTVVIFFLIIIIILIIIVMFGKKQKKLIVDDFDSNAWKNYAEKIYVEEGVDGWYNYFMIITIDKTYSKTENFFDGCNIKYKTLENYNILGYENGKLVEKVPTEPTLSVSEYSSNGVMERDEVIYIDSYFDNKQFNDKIALNQIGDLELHNFKKKDIMNLYNNAVETDFNSDIPIETNLTTCNTNMDKLGDNYIIVGTIFTRTGFKAVRMDIQYKDGTYLKDLVDSNKATKEQIKIYNNFTKMEDYIVKNNKLGLKEKFNFKGDIYEKIYEITEGFLEL